METYRGMDRDALSEAYNNRAVVPGWAAFMDDWTRRSVRLYATAPCAQDLSYDPASDRRRFDVFAGADPSLPTALYLHGGYWQWNDKEGQAFVAAGPLAQGPTVAIGEHSLAPAVSMTDLAEEIRLMVLAVSANARAEGRNPAVALLGMSSGAHLLSLALDMEEVACALLISGAYDLEPVRLSPLNDAIGMDWAEARRFSPLHRPHPQAKPVTIAFGANERPEIRRQGADFHAALSAQGFAPELLPVEDRDHFSVLETLADPTGVLCEALTRLARTCAIS